MINVSTRLLRILGLDLDLVLRDQIKASATPCNPLPSVGGHELQRLGLGVADGEAK